MGVKHSDLTITDTSFDTDAPATLVWLAALALVVNLIRIIAEVRARTPEEHAFLRAVKTGDRIRLRGRVAGIVLRTAVMLDPAVVAT
jgi:hypothetical protein